MEKYFTERFKFKCNNYRVYSEAYFEEIIIEYKIDTRNAKNFRENFLTDLGQVKKILEMYSKNDYINHFLRLQIMLPHQDFMDLFAICVRNDAWKIGMQIYLRHFRV